LVEIFARFDIFLENIFLLCKGFTCRKNPCELDKWAVFGYNKAWFIWNPTWESSLPAVMQSSAALQ
jgi:hypothetical protein